MNYPVLGYLDDFFNDTDGDPLTYSARVSVSNITATVVATNGNWSIQFSPEENWNGIANLTFRVTDLQGALAETTVVLTVLSVPDQPVLSLPDSFKVSQGSRSLLEVSRNVTDPDSVLADFRWVLDSEYPEFISIHGGIMALDFPEDFLTNGEKSRKITVSISVTDQNNLISTDNMTITVTRQAVATNQSPVLWLGLLASAGSAAVLSAYSITRRRKPFVIHDMMLIHNDGFLIGRHAGPHEGDIDEDILSGMLTAVLNFVDDSMSGTTNELKTFGFKEYQVLVSRGQKTYLAVVYEGEVPDGIEKPLSEFIQTIERIYKKNLGSWTGDIETDFAGVEVLIQGFVKEHSKKGRARTGGIWKTMQTKAKGKVIPKKVTVNTITRAKTDGKNEQLKTEGPTPK
jgi:hypothetical protein